MKTKEIRGLSVIEIQAQISQVEKELGQLTFQHTITSLENPMVLREKRRTIARLKTIHSEKKAAGEA
jgi:large subunit ribosomal protein L29